MLTLRTVELDYTFGITAIFRDGSAYSQNVTIWVPFAALDEHAGVDEIRLVIANLPHHLHSTALVSDNEASSIFRRILIGEPLLVVIVPLDTRERHL